MYLRETTSYMYHILRITAKNGQFCSTFDPCIDLRRSQFDSGCAPSMHCITLPWWYVFTYHLFLFLQLLLAITNSKNTFISFNIAKSKILNRCGDFILVAILFLFMVNSSRHKLQLYEWQRLSGGSVSCVNGLTTVEKFSRGIKSASRLL